MAWVTDLYFNLNHKIGVEYYSVKYADLEAALNTINNYN